MKNYLSMILSLMWAFQTPSFAGESDSDQEAAPAAVVKYQFDEMIENFRSKEGRVEITMFNKLQFDAEIVALPQSAKTQYIQRLLRDFGGSNPPAVTHGMRVKPANGAEYQLYVLDELVPGMQEMLAPGDHVVLNSYHAYNSPYGPGLLVYAYKRQPQPTLIEKAQQWWSESEQ